MPFSYLEEASVLSVSFLEELRMESPLKLSLIHIYRVDSHPGGFPLLRNFSSDISEQRTRPVRHLVFRYDTPVDMIAQAPFFIFLLYTSIEISI